MNEIIDFSELNFALLTAFFDIQIIDTQRQKKKTLKKILKKILFLKKGNLLYFLQVSNFTAGKQFLEIHNYANKCVSFSKIENTCWGN